LKDCGSGRYLSTSLSLQDKVVASKVSISE
jgi:hypothetical protein